MSNPLNVVAIIAAYNEEDVIGQVVRALIDEGVQVYFLDNYSTDRTVAEVEPFRDRGVIGIETFPPERDDAAARSFTWERILRRKEALAQELDADWFIHHDADEFRESPWSGQSLRDSIGRVDAAGYNAIDFQVMNFSPTADDPADAADIRHRLVFCEPARAFDRLQVKCWKKTDQPVVLTRTGGHSAEFAGRRIFPIRFLLRHYPIRSQDQGARKVLKERLPRFDAAERAKGWHVQYNGYTEHTSFVRDPDTLTRYDAEATRFDLFLRHRDVERLERAASANQDVADQLADDQVSLRHQRETRDAEFEVLREDRDHLRNDLGTARSELAAGQAAIASLTAELATKKTAMSVLRAELAEKGTAIANLLGSRSWRATAPIRRAHRRVRQIARAVFRRGQG